MLLREVKEILHADVLTCDDNLDVEVKSCCAADLMSDVLASVSMEKPMLLTGLVNMQVVRTAEMMDIKAICFVRGKKPTSEILECAEEMSIVILTTNQYMFNSSGLLFSKGLGGES